MHRRRSRLCPVALCALLTLSACGGSSDDEADASTLPDGGPTPDAAASIDAAPDAAPPLTGIDALCDAQGGVMVEMLDRSFDCLPWNNFSGQLVRLLLGGVLNTNRFSDYCYGQFQDYFTDGTLLIDETALDACRTWLMTGECYEFEFTGTTPNNPCAVVLDGQVPTDGDCEQSFQCAGNAYCAPADGCGTCTARVANDGECSTDDMCQSGYCHPGNAATCQDEGDVGDECVNANGCIGALTCDTTQEPAVCADAPPVPQPGDDCSDSAMQCGMGIGLYCNGDLLECEMYPDVGDDCLSQGELEARCDLINHEWCNVVSGKCQGPETAGEGDPCSVVADYQVIPVVPPQMCDADLVCLNVEGQPAFSGTCVKPGGLGDSCGGDGDPPCHALLRCDGQPGHCVGGTYSGLCPAP